MKKYGNTMLYKKHTVYIYKTVHKQLKHINFLITYKKYSIFMKDLLICSPMLSLKWEFKIQLYI